MRIKNIKIAMFLAYKNVVFNKKSLFLISFIIGLTYLSGIFIGAIILGLQVLIEDKAINTLISNIIILPKDGKTYITDVDQIVKKIKSVPGVVDVTYRIVIPAQIIDKEGNVAGFNLVVGQPEKEKEITIIDDSIVEGKYLSKNTKTGIVLGGALTEKYKIFESIERVDVSAGDRVKLIAFGKTYSQKILGIYSINFGGAELYGYINYNQAKRLFPSLPENVATHILVKTTDKYNEMEIIDILEQLGIDAKILSWQEQLGTFQEFIESLMIMNKIALLVSIIVAFGTIYIMMYINALQKRSQLGILKAIGIYPDIIILSYIFQGIIYGILGVVFGLIIAFTSYLYFSANPIQMPFGNVIPYYQIDTIIKSSFFIIIFSSLGAYFSSRSVVNQNILDMIFRG